MAKNLKQNKMTNEELLLKFVDYLKYMGRNVYYQDVEIFLEDYINKEFKKL